MTKTIKSSKKRKACSKCGRVHFAVTARCALCLAKKAAAALALVLLAAVPVAAQEMPTATCDNLPGFAAMDTTSWTPRYSFANEQQVGLLRATMDCVAKGDFETIRKEGVGLCGVLEAYKTAVAWDEKLTTFNEVEKIIVKANLALLTNACLASNERFDLERKIEALEQQAAALEAREMRLAAGEAKLKAEADALKAEADRDWRPLSKDTEKEMRAAPRGYGHGWYGDSYYGSGVWMLERQRRDAERAEDQAQAEEDRREDRRQHQEEMEAARQLRDAQEAETARRRGELPPSRLEWYHQ